MIRELATNSEFVSAITGAIVGGAIAFAINFFNVIDARAQRRAAIRELRASQAHSLIFKLMRISSNIQQIKIIFDGLDRKSAVNPNLRERWQIYSPISYPPEEIHLSADEVGLMLIFKKSDLFNSIMDQDRNYHFIRDQILLLNEMHKDLQSRISSVRMDGEISTSRINQELLASVRPAMLSIAIIFDNLYDTLKEYELRSFDTLQQILEICRREIDLKLVVERVVKN